MKLGARVFYAGKEEQPWWVIATISAEGHVTQLSGLPFKISLGLAICAAGNQHLLFMRKHEMKVSDLVYVVGRAMDWHLVAEDELIEVERETGYVYKPFSDPIEVNVE